LEEDAGKTEEVLGKIGIAVRKNDKEFRSFTAIMNDLNVKWKDLSNVQQLNVAQTIAGKMCA
jgi:TP901 family phage tail tape measure protein